ncbi:hypothetical protein ACQCVP_11905 [Rossellomorea vietnamensis]|uniref:hypothetical protein n=1 Tax=Rossellomorea vietnamensis TaxID=218284 RepID=UPI003CE9ED38
MYYNNRQNNLSSMENLREMVSAEEVRKFSGSSRKTYRILMVNIFSSMWRNDGRSYHDFFTQAMLMINLRDNDYEILESGEFQIKRDYWCKELYDNEFKFIKFENQQYIIDDEELLNKALKFCNDYIKEFLENDQKLYLYAIIQEFWDLKTLYRKKTAASLEELLPSNWIDLNPFMYPLPIYTFPDYLAYQDMINIWNDLVEKSDKIIHAEGREKRSLQFSLVSSIKYSLVASVHFTEVYLFYFYYLCRLEGKYPENQLIKRRNIRSVNDKEIITDLVYEEFEDIPDALKSVYGEYLKILEIRDAIVHLSPFKDENTKKSRIELTLDLDMSVALRAIKTCFGLVKETNDIIGRDLLFWLNSMEMPYFDDFSKISNLNKHVQ